MTFKSGPLFIDGATPPADGDVAVYDAALGTWKPGAGVVDPATLSRLMVTYSTAAEQASGVQLDPVPFNATVDLVGTDLTLGVDGRVTVGVDGVYAVSASLQVKSWDAANVLKRVEGYISATLGSSIDYAGFSGLSNDANPIGELWVVDRHAMWFLPAGCVLSAQAIAATTDASSWYLWDATVLRVQRVA